jgi:(S)-ureidoglycine aminohydrolase
MASNYYTVPGGHPPQSDLLTGRAVFTTAYAVIPKGVMQDIVTSVFPFWDATRGWVLARPLSGFAETFSQYIMEVLPGGGSDRPESDPGAEGALFVTQGNLVLTIEGQDHALRVGSFAFLPPGTRWTLRNRAEGPAQFH